MDPLLDQLSGGLVDGIAEAHAAECALATRLLRAVGDPINVFLAGVADVKGTLVRVGRNYVWVADATGFWLLALNQIDGLVTPRGSVPRGAQAALAAETPDQSLASVLRDVMHTGRSVSLLAGARWFAGSIGLVGKDFVEIGEVSVPVARMRACRVWY